MELPNIQLEIEVELMENAPELCLPTPCNKNNMLYINLYPFSRLVSLKDVIWINDSATLEVFAKHYQWK